MAVPMAILDAARLGDRETVVAWLDSPGAMARDERHHGGGNIEDYTPSTRPVLMRINTYAFPRFLRSSRRDASWMSIFAWLCAAMPRMPLSEALNFGSQCSLNQVMVSAQPCS